MNCLTRNRKTLSKLRYLGTSEQLRLNCYITFIESFLLFHMTIIYKHIQEPMSVKESAEKLSKLKLPKPSDTIDHCIQNKAGRLATSIDAPLLKFDKLPSGSNLRRNCFRAWAVAFLNRWFISETVLVFLYLLLFTIVLYNTFYPAFYLSIMTQ